MLLHFAPKRKPFLRAGPEIPDNPEIPEIPDNPEAAGQWGAGGEAPRARRYANTLKSEAIAKARCQHGRG